MDCITCEELLTVIKYIGLTTLGLIVFLAILEGISFLTRDW